MTNALDVNRRLRMWKYSVSHSQLLLLSPKNDLNPTRFHVLFKGVESVSLTTDFHCGRILVEPLNEHRKRYTLVGESHRHTVVAGYIFPGEDDLGDFAPVPMGIF